MSSEVPSPTKEASNELEIRNVLLVEDDVEVAITTKAFLEAEDFMVTTVTNGAEGLREVMAFDFDAIVCDMMMPKMPGDMFYVAVSRAKPYMCRRFIFVTGFGGDPRVAEFIEKVHGIVLNKPISGQELVKTIRQVIGASRAEQP